MSEMQLFQLFFNYKPHRCPSDTPFVLAKVLGTKFEIFGCLAKQNLRELYLYLHTDLFLVPAERSAAK